MDQKELTKTFMMILNCKKPSLVMVYTELFQRFKAERVNVIIVVLMALKGLMGLVIIDDNVSKTVFVHLPA